MSLGAVPPLRAVLPPLPSPPPLRATNPIATTTARIARLAVTITGVFDFFRPAEVAVARAEAKLLGP